SSDLARAAWVILRSSRRRRSRAPAYILRTGGNPNAPGVAGDRAVAAGDSQTTVPQRFLRVEPPEWVSDARRRRQRAADPVRRSPLVRLLRLLESQRRRTPSRATTVVPSPSRESEPST